MPTYEYACDSCCTIYQTPQHGINAAKLAECPQCKLPLRRLMATPNPGAPPRLDASEGGYPNPRLRPNSGDGGDVDRIYKTIWLPGETKQRQ